MSEPHDTAAKRWDENADRMAARPASNEVRERSEGERHAIAYAKYLCDRAGPDDPEICCDYEVVRTLLSLIPALAAEPGESKGDNDAV